MRQDKQGEIVKNIRTLFCMLCITHSIYSGGGRPSMLDQRLKKEPLPAEKASAFSRVHRTTAVKAARLRQLPKAGSLQIPVKAYLAQTGSLEQNFSTAEYELQKGNKDYLQRLREDLIQAQKFFAEVLEQLNASDKKKIAEEFESFVYSPVEEWKAFQRQRLLTISSRMKQLEEQVAAMKVSEQAPAKRAKKSVHFEEPIDVQKQLLECRRFYDELNHQHEELIKRFVQTVTMRKSDKKEFDELRSQLDKLITGREQLNELYARDRAQFMQEIARLQQQPAHVPEGVLQELTELRKEITQFPAQLDEAHVQERKRLMQHIDQSAQLNTQAVAQLEEIENKVRMCEIELSAIKNQRDEYKNALDDIFAGIVVGIPYEELSDPKAQKVAELKAKAESDKMIANLAAEKFQQLQTKNLISIPEIHEKIDKKIEAMMEAVNQPKKQLKAEPPQKK